MQTADPLLVLLACALRNHRLRRQIDQQRFQANYRGVELEALYEVGLAIASTLDPQGSPRSSCRAPFRSSTPGAVRSISSRAAAIV